MHYFRTHGIRETPSWTLDGITLKEEASVTYLGTTMSDNPTNHIKARISAARRAFYGLQSAGLCSGGVAPHTAAYIYNVAIQPVLSFGCATVNIKSSHIKELEKTQGMLIKAALKLHKSSRNTSLVQALNVKKVKYILDFKQLNLYKNCLLNTSRVRALYLHLIRKHQFCDMSRNNSLYSRCSSICKIKGISLMRYTFDSKYAMRCKRNATILPPDGISDTINTLLLTYDHNSMQAIKMLLKPY